MYPRVLIVDDDESVRSGLSANLEEEGFEVCAASSGGEAIRTLHAHNADIVLADLVMDGMDGMDLLRRLTQDHPYLPVVVLTGHGTPGNAVEALHEGAADFIQKPAQPADIAHRLRTILDARRFGLRLQEERHSAILRDRTENARREQERCMAALSRFAHGLIHMLEPTLTELQQVTPTLRAGRPPPPSLADGIEIIRRGVHEANATLSRIRRLTEEEHAGREQIDLNAVVREAVQPWTPLKTGIIQLRLNDDLPPVSGTRARLVQAVRAVLDVATDRLPEGQPVCVETDGSEFGLSAPVGLPPETRCVRLRIREPRPLTPEQAASAFEPFFADVELKRPGNQGFGLTTAFRIAEAHNGAIHVSDGGNAAVWTLFFPAAGPAGLSPQTADSTPAAEAPPFHVLVVDDQEEYREEAARLLRALGCRVSTSTGPQDALRAIDSDPPYSAVDLVLIDLILGDALDGVDLFHRMRAHKPNMKAVLVGGFAETDRVAQARAQGLCDYLRKPLTREALAQALRLVGKAQA